MNDVHDLYVKASCEKDFALLDLYSAFIKYCDTNKTYIYQGITNRGLSSIRFINGRAYEETDVIEEGSSDETGKLNISCDYMCGNSAAFSSVATSS